MSAMNVRPRRVRTYRTPDGREPFQDWLNGLKAPKVQSIILARINRLRHGNFGDHRKLTGDLYELRIHYGAGYRIYCGEQGGTIVIILCGGTKRTQRRDIQQAKTYWQDAKRRPQP
jgi:putative addiction module killer protein